MTNMSDFGTYKDVKIRKEHSCIYCSRTIPIGSIARNYRGMWQGDWQNWYACGFCIENVEPCSDGEEINGSEFAEWFYDTDHMVCKKCETRYRNNWDWEDDSNTAIRVFCAKCSDEWVVQIPLEGKGVV